MHFRESLSFKKPTGEIDADALTSRLRPTSVSVIISLVNAPVVRQSCPAGSMYAGAARAVYDIHFARLSAVNRRTGVRHRMRYEGKKIRGKYSSTFC